jgi:hypothetical protein
MRKGRCFVTTRRTTLILATVAALGLAIPAVAAGPAMSGGNTFGNTNWNWSVTVPWDYGYNGSGYYGGGYYGTGLSDQQLQYAMLQQQWAAGERARIAQMRVLPPQREPKEPKPQAQAPQGERPPVPVQAPPPADPTVRAASKLRMARLLAEDGKTKDAADYYAEIVQKYPNTPAAAEARQLLQQPGK